MSSQIQLRRDTAANWTSANPTLAQGEIGIETDTGKLKIGTGATAWNSISYFVGNLPGATLDALGDVTITSVQNGDFLRYNGSASVWINDPVNLSTDTVGDYVQNLTAGTGVTLSNNSGEGATPTVAIGQDVATSASVQFAKVTAPVTGNLTGNADTATTLQTPRTISLSGDVSGSVSFNGSANVDITATVQPNSVALGTDTTGNYVNDVVAGTGISVTHTPGEGSSASVALDATLNDLSDVAINAFGLASGDVIEWNGSSWSNTNKLEIFGVSDLYDFNNPVFGPPANGTVLTYNNDNNKWQPKQPNYELGSQTTGLYVADLVAGTGVTITNGASESASPTIAIGQSVGTSSSVQFAAVTAPLIGNVTGNADTATTLATSRTIELTGDVTGSVSFNGSANASISATIQPNSVALGTDTTGNYVNDLTAGTGVTITHTPSEGSSPTVAIGQAVGTSASVTFAKIETTGDVTVGGNLTVNGTTTTLNTETLSIEDNIVVLNSNVTGSPTTNAGLEVERGTSANVVLRWNESLDKWEITEDGSTYSGIVTSSYLESRLFDDHIHPSVRVAQGDEFSGSVVYTNGSLDLDGGYGIGATLENTVNEALVIDNFYGSEVGDRVLVANQADEKRNGIYTVTNVGSVSQKWKLTRASDFDGSFVNSITPGEMVFAFEGDVYGGHTYVIESYGTGPSRAHIIGTDNITVAQADGTQNLVEGGGIQFSGNAIGLTAVAGSVISGPESRSFLRSLSLDSYGRVTSVTESEVGTTMLGVHTSGDYVSMLGAGTGIFLASNSGASAIPSISIGQDVSQSASVEFARVYGTNVVGQTITASVFVGQLNGNASTATKLAAPQNIAGQAFDGSTPISIAPTDLTGVTATAAEINTLDGILASTSELNILYGVIADASEINILNGVTSSTAELNILDGVTASTSEINILDGVTSTTAEINILDGVTATAAEINILDGATLSTSELNTLDGVTATASEINILFGANVSTTELNYLVGVSSSVQTQLNSKAPLDSPTFTGTVVIPDNTVALGTKTTGDYVSTITAGTGVSSTAATTGEGTTHTLSIGQAVGTSASVTFAHVSAPVTGNVTGNVTGSSGSTTGNAATATALQNARTISLSGDVSGSVSFNGSADASITATIQPNSVALGTDTTGDYMSGVSVQNGLTVSHTPGEGSSAIIGVDNALITNFLLEGAAGNSYGLIGTSAYLDVKNTNGYNKEIELDIAAVKTQLNTDGYLTESSTSTLTNKTLTSPVITGVSPVITLAGDLSGSATFTNLGNATLTATIAENSVALGTDTTGNYVNDLTAGTGVTVTHTPGEGSSPTVAIGQAVGTSSSVLFAQVETTGSLIVGQNIYVSGSVVTENQVSLQIDDPFIYLASSGSVANTDFGIAGNYNDGTYHHSGVFRDATDGKWKFFDSYVPEPVHPIDTAHASYSPAPVVADFFESVVANGTAPLTVSSSTVVTNLNADKLDGQDGSYYAPLDSPTFTGTVSLPNNTVALGTQTTGNYMLDVSAGTGLSVSHTQSEGSTATVSLNATLDNLSNVTAPSPADGNFLKYVSASAAWVPAAVPTINALDDIGDVSAASPTTGHFLQWNGTAWVPAEAGAVATSTTASVNTIITVDSFDKTVSRSAEFTVQVTQGTKYTTVKALVLHDGTTAQLVQYGLIEIGATLIPLTLSADISGSDVRLRATITNAATTNATIKVLKTPISV